MKLKFRVRFDVNFSKCFILEAAPLDSDKWSKVDSFYIRQTAERAKEDCEAMETYAEMG